MVRELRGSRLQRLSAPVCAFLVLSTEQNVLTSRLL